MLQKLLAVVTTKPVFALLSLPVTIWCLAKQPRRVIGASLVMAGLTVFSLPLVLSLAKIGLNHVPGNAPVPMQWQFALIAIIMCAAGVIVGWLTASLFDMTNRRFAGGLFVPFLSIGLWFAHAPVIIIITLPLGGGMLIGALLAEKVTRFGAVSVQV